MRLALAELSRIEPDGSLTLILTEKVASVILSILLLMFLVPFRFFTPETVGG